MIKKSNVVNHHSMKQFNQMAVLNMLRRNGEMSRAELSRELSCDGTTITNITRELIEQELVMSLGAMASNHPGRPREILELNPAARQVIGISFDPRLICGIITDLNGKLLFQKEIHFEAEIDQKKFLAHLEAMCRTLQHNVAAKRLLGIGVATFGPLSPGENILHHTRHLPAIENINMTEFFSQQFNRPPTMIDGTAAKVMTELWHDHREEEKKNFILVDADVGIGAAIVARGRLLSSEKGCIGEFGHTVFDPEGEPCKCGLRGCLETLSSASFLEQKIAGILKKKEVSFDAVVAKYRSGDPAVRSIVDRSARWLGVAVANLINLLIPEKIILSGLLTTFGDDYLTQLRNSAAEFTFPAFRQNQISIQTSSFGSDAAALGAAINLLRRFFDEQ